MSAYSNDSRRHSYHSSRRDTESCYQSSRSRGTEPASDKHHNKRASSHRTEAMLESEGSAGGHQKSRSKKQRSSIEDDDLSQPWVCKKTDSLTPRIRYFDLPKRTRMPSHVKTYDGSEDPEDHLNIFQAAAAKVERWEMPTWCHMFNSTLSDLSSHYIRDIDTEPKITMKVYGHIIGIDTFNRCGIRRRLGVNKVAQFSVNGAIITDANVYEGGEYPWLAPRVNEKQQQTAMYNVDESIHFFVEASMAMALAKKWRLFKDIFQEVYEQNWKDKFEQHSIWRLAMMLARTRILQLVLLGAESRRNIPKWLLRIGNDRVAWNKYPWGSYVWPTLYSQLRNADVRRWGPLYVDHPTNEDDLTTYSIFGYTWSFKGNIPAARLTPDDNEARSDWWIPSKAYFNGFIDQEQMLKFKEEMNARPVRQENTVPINVGQHYGFSDFSQFQGMQQRQMPEQSASHYWQPSPQPGSYYSFGQLQSHIDRLNLQTTIEMHHDVDGIVNQNIPNRGKRQQLPRKYLVTPFTVQPPTTIVPKQCVSKTKNKGKKASLLPLNLGGVLEGYNEEDKNVTFFGSQFTSNILFYENVDPAKVRRGNYENVLHFLNNPYHIYLDWYTRGYIVPITFWQELAPHLCMSDMQRLSYGTLIGWLGGEHMNSWMELMIRRPLNVNRTLAYTSTISVNPENNQFIILKDLHVIGTLDGSTRLYPSWNDVDWITLNFARTT
uniref:Reverse transcriptase domain-containing protein n=1 Tax=Tanacetum cinerariifolium TaxID=118510 RepID=A0A6L2MN66_TANCI|nr:reverse transcriptase domain-containing protein [Tanacetum cinerariifolium]